MSTHPIEVVRIASIDLHPNADRLGLVTVFGWRCAVALGQFQPGDLVAYLPPDSFVDTRRPEFSFLHREGRDYERIRVKRLRGVYSQGLLVQAPAGAVVGDDVAEQLGVGHYEPPEGTACDAERGPLSLYAPTYDVENFRRYPDVIGAEELVIVTEKIHGTNARFLWHERLDRYYVGSHRQWKREGDNPYWRALRLYESTVGALLKAEPWLVTYGEVFGVVGNFRYGMAPDTVDLRLFDLWDTRENRWLAWSETHERIDRYGLPWVPILHDGVRGPLDALLARAEGPSQIAGAGCVREGAVVRLAVERREEQLGAMAGRVLLKIVGNGYLERG